ncbi:MAG: kelch repeat-containing protein [Pseudomonadota bacterium]
MLIKWLVRILLTLLLLAFIVAFMWWIQPTTGLSICLADTKENEHWQLRNPMQILRSEIAAAALDNKIYVAGGISFFRMTGSAEAYDIGSDTWTAIATLPRPLHHVALASCRGQVFASGGYTELNFVHDPSPMLWRYDVFADQWLDEAKLPNPLGEHAMICLNEQLFMVGGRELGGATSAVWIYDMTARNWQRKPDMPTPRHSSALAVLDDWLYVIGGRNSIQGAHVDVVEAYHALDERWETRAPLPTGRGGHAAASLNGRIHVFGGERFDVGQVMDEHHVYDPVQDRWQVATSMATPRHGLTAAVVDERIYAIGGGCHHGLNTIYSVTGTVQTWQP